LKAWYVSIFLRKKAMRTRQGILRRVLPSDGVAADTSGAEQYLAWHLVNVPVASPAMKPTRIDGVKL
jgi:hypothetical protein